MFKSKSEIAFLRAAKLTEKAMRDYKLLPLFLGSIQKVIIKSKIEKLFSVKVTEITREWLTVESTDKDTTHLNKSWLRDSIRLEIDLQVVVV